MLPLADATFQYTPTPFGFLAAGAFLGFGLCFLWHCIIFAWSPLKWFREFIK